MTGGAGAAAHALAAIFLAALMLPPIGRNEYWRALLAWALSAPILFLVSNPAVILILAFAILALLAPVRTSKRIAFFIAMVPFLPGNVQALIPFAGVNFLIIITPFKLCVLTVLLPLLFSRNASGGNRTITAIVGFLVFGICTVFLIESAAKFMM
jgi:hypothetical protein